MDNAEMAQWIQGMMPLIEAYKRIVGMTIKDIKDSEDGLVMYNEGLAKGELPALSEKLRKMSVPQESQCKQVKKALENGINALINIQTYAERIDKYGMFFYAKGWKFMMADQVVVSTTMLTDVVEGFDSLRKKYQI